MASEGGAALAGRRGFVRHDPPPIGRPDGRPVTARIEGSPLAGSPRAVHNCSVLGARRVPPMLLRRLFPRRRRVPPVPDAPWALYVEITNECNLECPMCARTTSMTRAVEDMTPAVYRRVIDEADELGVEKIRLHMFGESLLHPQVYELIPYAAAKPHIRQVALSTNVTPLTEENSRRLLDTGLSRQAKPGKGESRHEWVKPFTGIQLVEVQPG